MDITNEEFSCQFFVRRINGDEFEHEDVDFTSTIPNLMDDLDFEIDVISCLEDRNDYKNIKENVWHHIYLRGKLDYYISSGFGEELDETIWQFYPEIVRINEVSDYLVE